MDSAPDDLDFIIEVDGGIHADTIRDAAGAGCDLVVVGSAVFNHAASVADNIAALRAGLPRGNS